jgi:hypothetical protein
MNCYRYHILIDITFSWISYFQRYHISEVSHIFISRYHIFIGNPPQSALMQQHTPMKLTAGTYACGVKRRHVKLTQHNRRGSLSQSDIVHHSRHKHALRARVRARPGALVNWKRAFRLGLRSSDCRFFVANVLSSGGILALIGCAASMGGLSVWATLLAAVSGAACPNGPVWRMRDCVYVYVYVYVLMLSRWLSCMCVCVLLLV